MKMLTPEEIRGIEAEARFFEIMATCDLPPWIEEVRQVTARYDACGVDAIIAVRRYDGVRVDVPVQIKSSYARVEEHLREHAEHWFQRLVFAVVHEFIGEKKILEYLLAELRHVRCHRYDFVDFFHDIDRNNLNVFALDLQVKRALVAHERKSANG